MRCCLDLLPFQRVRKDNVPKKGLTMRGLEARHLAQKKRLLKLVCVPTKRLETSELALTEVRLEALERGGKETPRGNFKTTAIL